MTVYTIKFKSLTGDVIEINGVKSADKKIIEAARRPKNWIFWNEKFLNTNNPS